MLDALKDKYDNQGVAVIEVNKAMINQKALVNWTKGFDYYGLRVDPADLVADDFEKTEILRLRANTLIDLTTMRVLNNDCGFEKKDVEQCILDHL